MVETISREEARRIVLAAQGLATTPARRGHQAAWRSLQRSIDRLNLLQIDSVNVLARAHYLPLYSRLGAYRRETLDARAFANGRGRALFEYWAHEASLLPLKFYPLLRWRMEAARRGNGIYKDLARFVVEKREFVKAVLAEVQSRGPLTARELSKPGERTGPWWGWHDGKIALEYLFWTGEVTAAGRHNTFERIYDVPEKVIRSDILRAPALPQPDAIRELVRLSASALGVASEADLRDYFRLPVSSMKRAIGELVEAGDLMPIAVEGWRMPGWLCGGAALPRRATGTALLSPFDPLVWERGRTERLFGFRYRIEIYTPASKRAFGYYVLPFLHKGRFAARVCLKANRAAGVLRVNTAHLEESRDAGETAEALAAALGDMSRWLGLQGIAVNNRGDLAQYLKTSVQRLG